MPEFCRASNVHNDGGMNQSHMKDVSGNRIRLHPFNRPVDCGIICKPKCARGLDNAHLAVDDAASREPHIAPASDFFANVQGMHTQLLRTLRSTVAQDVARQCWY
jgi:hypothetical protein